MKATSQPVRPYSMQGSICFGRGLKLTSKTTQGVVGVHQEEQASQRATAASWDSRRAMAKAGHGFLRPQRQVLHSYLWLFPATLRESYLQRMHEGHLSASKTVLNARQHMFWPGIEADIKDYTRSCRCASRGAGQPESHCSLMRFQMGHGKSWAWISSTSKASVTFLSVIISQSSLSCLVAKPVGVH